VPRPPVVQPPQVRRLEQELPVVMPPAVPPHPLAVLREVEPVVVLPVVRLAAVVRPAVADHPRVVHPVETAATALEAKATVDRYPTLIRTTKSTNCVGVVEATAGEYGDVDSGPGSTSRP
jgi:hypothetical protein